MNFLKLNKLGPGLLYAGAAIGVSHLVQSTRAGASFGLIMIAVVIVVNILKYPFFQYGPRYTAATGNSLLDGYKKLGSWAVWLFFFLTLGTMFIIQGAITMVTAGLAKYITSSTLDIWVWMLLISIFSWVILGYGKLKLLNTFMKVVMLVLAVTTIAAAIASIFTEIPKEVISAPFRMTNSEHLFFIIAFIGWMPAPIDISVWYSVWSQESTISNKPLKLQDSLFDFSVGYWGTAFLAVCFVALGAMMLHNTGTVLSSSAVVFSGQIIEAYTLSLGNWATPIISVAAFTTMLSTTITVMDGLTRVMVPTIAKIAPKPYSLNRYSSWSFTLVAGSLFIIWKFGSNMKSLVDLATTISFLTAPIIGYLNIKVMSSDYILTEFKPSVTTQVISYLGLGSLVILSVVFLTVRFF
ncbi:MAG: Mn2+/Fe2+ NRAMP family transporter [Salibacteraceae bacterium]|jgi:Mn2+/Fe2+ NRAMP family transporter